MVFLFEVAEEAEDGGMGEEVGVGCGADGSFPGGRNILRGGGRSLCLKGCFGGGGVRVFFLGFARGRVRV